MADNNRNRRDADRQQYDGNDHYGRQQQRNDGDEPNYTTSENRGHRDGGRHTERSGDGGWQTRYERQMGTSREGDFDGGNHQRPYGRQNDDHNRGGSPNRGISSGYSDFGGNYSRGDRNLYDRGNQGMGRRDFDNSENRIGGGNYDRYGDHGRYDQNRSGGYSNSSFGMATENPSYGASHGNFGGGNYGSGRTDYGRSGKSDYGRSDYGNRGYGRGDDERSWWDRTTDEVSSWFGDEDAERRRQSDKNFRGKGPRNYSRSDERIKEDINDRLSDDPFVDASDIDVAVTSGEVTLTGTVDHRSTKRRAEDLAEAVSGVRNVENRLRVMQMTGSQNTGASGENNPSGSTGSQSSSAVPGSERSRTTSKDSNYANK